MSIFRPDWIGAVGTVLLAILAVFQDKIRGWITRPRLKLAVGAAPPYFHKTTWTHPFPHNSPLSRPGVEISYLPCYYFRVAVHNMGNTAAREVEVNAVSLRRKRADGSFEPVSRFTPMNLLWAHEHNVYLHLLSPQLAKFCDIGHIIAPADRLKLGHDLPGAPAEKCIFAFDLQSEPNMKGHLVESGTYRLELLIAAENCRPEKYTVELIFSGDWFESQDGMFADGFGMRLV
jgi:hypothetical protein